ncbi:cupin domain-containing protein [Streptomyces sp. NBC_01435]|uniref:cupin domain-containing protein n=1 Tax=Streptomyces sp. NBC_01435 TaxID=2903865 RepID=UPI002E3785D2|nr:cupin domain-containing protein [Streptomyces sp. NBC_01435]
MSLIDPYSTDPRYTKRSALYVPSGEGETSWVFADTYTLKAGARETNGTLTFLEATVPPEGGPEPHIHNDHDEAFYVISGELEFLNGDETVTASAGGFFFVPRGTRHRFRNRGYHAAKMIFFFTPGGIEELLLAGATPAEPGVAPPIRELSIGEPPTELMERYATEVLPDPS